MAESKKADAGKALSKSAVHQALAEKTNLTKKQVSEFFDALTDLIKRELGKKGPGVFNVIPGLLQLKLKRRPATKARKGPDPFHPGQEMVYKAKAARNDVRPRALKMGRMTWLLFAVCVAYLALAVVLPMLTLYFAPGASSMGHRSSRQVPW